MFTEHHPEIATLDFWQSMKQRNRAGDFPDFFPYPSTLRLHSTVEAETAASPASPP